MAPLKSHCLNKNEFVTCFVPPTTEAIYIFFVSVIYVPVRHFLFFVFMAGHCHHYGFGSTTCNRKVLYKKIGLQD